MCKPLIVSSPAAFNQERQLEPVSVLEGAIVRLKGLQGPVGLYRISTCRELGSHMELVIEVRVLHSV